MEEPSSNDDVMPVASRMRRVMAEALGTALLLVAIVGSGIMAERLSGGSRALALLANSIATGGALVALIAALSGISGAHFNPLVSLAAAFRREIDGTLAAGYVIGQVVGAIAGVALVQVMFDEPIALSRHARAGVGQLVSEVVATFGLLVTISGCARHTPRAVPFAVASYIVAAYWFTASTSFANPAVTVARALTDTFAGIRPLDVPGFIGAQTVGAIAAIGLFGWLDPRAHREKELRP